MLLFFFAIIWQAGIALPISRKNTLNKGAKYLKLKQINNIINQII